ncbi:MAG: hypothetical protein IJT18_00555 [Oscillospiraceae bacterium]|nr:hypothetical protein [Oscillospiraceae bacterium]
MRPEITQSEWNGFRRLDFLFEDRPSILVLPDRPRGDGKWLFKTEYFKSFPSFQIEMLSRGYALAHMQSVSRWCPPEDTAARARFCKFLHDEFSLAPTCFPVGMSCGGMQAVYLASEYPHLIAALYLDAPVMNLLSCPCGLGAAVDDHMYEEFYKARGMTVAALLNYRDHPVDRIPALIESRIPVALVCGDSDGTVPYLENGKLLSDAYRRAGLPFLEILKPGCDHHPHGLEDNTPLVEFAEKYYG